MRFNKVFVIMFLMKYLFDSCLMILQFTILNTAGFLKVVLVPKLVKFWFKDANLVILGLIKIFVEQLPS